MTRKNQRGSGGGRRGNRNGSTGNEIPTESRTPGPLYCGEGFSFVSDEIDARLFTQDLCPGEFLILLLLNRDVWLRGTLIVQAGMSYLAQKARIGRRSAARHMKALRDKGLIHLESANFKETSWYFVEPVFIWSGKWHQLRGIEFSRLVKPCQNGTAKSRKNATHAKLAWEERQFGIACDGSAGTPPCQNGTHTSTAFSVVCDAPSQSPKDGPEGGENGLTSNGGKAGKRSPNGQVQTPIQKGVGLTADTLDGSGKGGRLSPAEFESRRKERLQQLRRIE